MNTDTWVPCKLPNGWVAARLDALCEVVRGGSPRPMGDPRYFGGTIPFLKIADVTRSGGIVVHETTTKVTQEGALRSRLIPAGRLVLTNSATVCVPVFLGVDTCIHDGFLAFEGLPDFVSQKYLFYFFKYIRPYVLDEHKQGVTQVNLNTGIVGEMSLILAPPNEQRRIVAKIEELFSETDKAVENLTAAQQQLEGYRHSLLKHAFEGKLTADWRAAHSDALDSAKTVLSKITQRRQMAYQDALKQSERKVAGVSSSRTKKPNPITDCEPIQAAELSQLPSVPDGWCYVRLGQLISRIGAGNSFRCEEREPRQDEIGVAKVSAVSWGEYDEAESKTCLDAARVNPELFIRPGDFLLSRANTIELVGACVIVSRVTKSVMLSDKTLRLDFDFINKSFYLHYLRSRTGRTEIEKRSTGNQDSMRNIGQDRIRSIIVPICSSEEMQEIVARLEALLSDVANLENTIATGLQRVSSLRQSILKQAFSGQLVPQDPCEEPASLLLERIRTHREANGSKPKKPTRPSKEVAA